MSCTSLTPRCKKVDKCCHNILFNILCCIHDVCQTFDIRYILDSGTMLGAVREGDIISYDTDIDISMTEKNFNIFKNNYKIIDETFFITEDSTEKQLIRINSSKINLLHVDIWVWKEEKEFYYLDYMKRRYFLEKKYIDNISTIRLRNNLFLCTEYKEEYCLLKFGEDWKTPIKNKPGTLRNQKI